MRNPQKGGGDEMAKQMAKNGDEKQGTRSRKVRDLPPKGLKARKAAAVRGGRKAGKGRTDYMEIKMNEVLISGS